MTYKYPNVKATMFNLDTGKEIDLDIHEDMKPFIDALAVKYPQWEFRNAYNKYVGSVPKAWRFEVFNDANPREEIGSIQSGHKYRKGEKLVTYLVYNKRLAQSRDRGQCYETINMKHAMRELHKYFNPPPVSYILEQTLVNGYSIYKHELGFAERRVRNTGFVLDAAKTKFVQDNWEQYKATLEPTLLQVAKEYEEQQEEYNRVYDMGKDGKHTAVVIHNDKYVVCCEDKVTTYDVNTVPIEIRANIGLLKLVEERQMVDDVGIRVSAECFFIFSPKVQEDGMPEM